MLAHHRRPVCLSFLSTDLPILSAVETVATLYQKDRERFHLLFNQPGPPLSVSELIPTAPMLEPTGSKRLLWLEISPYRAIMTLQGEGQTGYRHFWERGVYGTSRYWLHSYESGSSGSFRLRNYTRNLTLKGSPLPQTLRIDYELWTGQVQLGHYIFQLEVHH